MKKIICAITAVIACAISADADNLKLLKGRVLEKSSSEPLAYVTVALADTSGRVLGGATSDSLGVFSLGYPSASVETVRLLYSFVGYKDFTVALTDAIVKKEGNAAYLKDVYLEDDAAMLSSAVVSDKRPLIEHRFDRLVLNVSELAVAKTGSALDVLKSSPGVTVDKDGNVQLNGQTVSVWIDGRPSQMSGKDLESYLSGSTGDTIEKVELISNPSSKYDAEGSGGIINIKTKKGFMKGLNGSVRVGGGMNFLPKPYFNGSISANIMYRTDKTNTSLNISPSYYGNASEADEFKVYGEGNTSRQISHSLMKGHYRNINISLSNDWNISKKDVLGVIFRTYISNNASETLPGSTIKDYRKYGLEGEYLYSLMNSSSSANNTGDRYSANINYTRKFDESKMQELTLNADYSRTGGNVNNSQRNLFDKASFAPEAVTSQDYGFDDRTRRILDLYSLKADYSQIFWKSTGRIEAGAKAAISNTRNWFSKYDCIFGNPEGIPDGTLSETPSERNDFTYNEQVYAAYFNLAKQFSPKWSAQAGLRGEYTVHLGDWMTGTNPDGSSTGSQRTYMDYFDLFPSAFVSYTPSQKVILTANFSYRISRPKYWQMNPFRQYINATTYTQGNPKLNPSYSKNASLSAVLFNRLTLSAGYSHTRNYSENQVPVYDRSNGMMGLIYANAGVQQGGFVTASLSELPLTKWWNLTVNAYYLYSVFKAYSGVSAGMEENYTNTGHSFNGYLSTTFFLPKSFKLSLDGFATTPMVAGYYRINPLLMFGFSAEKSFWDGNGQLAFRVNDFANTFKSDLFIKSEGEDIYGISNKYGNIGISLSFTWRFGTATSSSRRNVGTLDEESRM